MNILKKSILTIMLVPMFSFSSDFVNIIKSEGLYILDLKQPDMTFQAWENVTYDLSKYTPGSADGSSGARAKFKFNFGQEPFLGNQKGFMPYDSNYEESKWVNCDSYNGYCSPYLNGGVAYYNHKNNSGQKYFEITTGDLDTAPFQDSLGMINPDYHLNYYYFIGLQASGAWKNGLYWGRGDGSYFEWSNSGRQESGTVLQVWIDYDNSRMSIMELGQNENFYFNNN